MSVMNEAVQRGRALLALGRPQEAQAHFRQALVSDPGNADLHQALGQALLAQDRYADARTALTRSVAAEPDSAFSLLLLSGAEAGLGNRSAALEAARAALRLVPLSPQVHHQIGALLLNSGQSLEALPWLLKARELDPMFARAATSLAIVYLQLRRYDEARTQIQEALQLEPNDPSAHFVNGLIETAAGGSRQGVRAHREALRLDPTNPVNRAGLVEALKNRNAAYRALVRYGAWRESLTPGNRKLLAFAPMFAVVLLRPFSHTTVGTALIGCLLFLVYLSWAVDPMSNLALCVGNHRNLLEPPVRRSAILFGVYFVAALGCVVWGVLAGPPEPFVVAVIFAIWSIVAGFAHQTLPRFRRTVVAAHAVGVMLLAGLCYLAATGSTAFNGAVVLVGLVGGAVGLLEIVPAIRAAAGRTAA
ncbi:tetratricopeptide repeat protein [Flexivirga oryzae]|uniref:Tetratricopeptide (TPR) repeat protein n=1 Tax=Flexivirga oryzae TaxID=1794944 RepID=A0A839N3G8_9MICO|nr:tetratricopeptide repeat protein [Flexivirga oryzae]MBB2891857.1 tetratricopeptide (TPR) repeat protein [Flexivirga oryzae]